jgi:hypothetical protein
VNPVTQACQVLSTTRDAGGGVWGEPGGGLIYGPVAGQHLTYRGDMLVNGWANGRAALTTQDPSSETHALCAPQTTGSHTKETEHRDRCALWDPLH